MTNPEVRCESTARCRRAGLWAIRRGGSWHSPSPVAVACDAHLAKACRELPGGAVGLELGVSVIRIDGRADSLAHVRMIAGCEEA